MYFIDALSGACDKVVFEVRESLRSNIGVFMRFQACGGIPQAFFVGRMVIAWRRGGVFGSCRMGWDVAFGRCSGDGVRVGACMLFFSVLRNGMIDVRDDRIFWMMW